MDEDIVTRLRNDVCDTRPCVGCELSSAAADEIERLRKWAAYEHAGYCGCAGGDKECVNRAYTTWKKVFGE